MGELSQPVIVCAAIRNEGATICGARHFDDRMREIIKIMYPDEDYLHRWSYWTSGFIDQFGTFYDREEAMIVAKKAGQRIDFERNRSPYELYSEGLY